MSISKYFEVCDDRRFGFKNKLILPSIDKKAIILFHMLGHTLSDYKSHMCIAKFSRGILNRLNTSCNKEKSNNDPKKFFKTIFRMARKSLCLVHLSGKGVPKKAPLKAVIYFGSNSTYILMQCSSILIHRSRRLT